MARHLPSIELVEGVYSSESEYSSEISSLEDGGVRVVCHSSVCCVGDSLGVEPLSSDRDGISHVGLHQWDILSIGGRQLSQENNMIFMGTIEVQSFYRGLLYNLRSCRARYS